MGKVYLTGAGPGDIELLTVKALRVVKEADVIIYDRLANPDILAEAKDGCEFVYVGKEDSHHTLPQEEINEVIYQAALKHENVVRLKGETLLFLDAEEKRGSTFLKETSSLNSSRGSLLLSLYRSMQVSL